MNIIETDNLCKQYGAALRVAHLDMRVPEGSVYGFLGPNGAGKSTTLKMLLGLVRPTEGSIRMLGKSMDRTNRLAILRQVGSLIESPAITAISPGRKTCASSRPSGMCRKKISGKCWR